MTFSRLTTQVETHLKYHKFGSTGEKDITPFINKKFIQGPSIAENQAQDPRYLFYNPTDIRYITELDAIREILFMLSGRPSFLFSEVKDQIQVNLNALLTHLSEGSFKGLLQFFCDQGNMLAKLKGKLTRAHSSIYGQTTQAFAFSVLTMVSSFENKLSDLESEYRIGTAQSQDSFASLLFLQNRLSDDFLKFQILYEFLVQTPLNEVPPYKFFDEISQNEGDPSFPTPYTPLINPAHLAFTILSGLYKEILHHQTIGNKCVFLMFAKHFDNTFVPYMRMIDNWIRDGTLKDPAEEFFIVKYDMFIFCCIFHIRSSDIKSNSSNYWQEMFKIRTLPVSSKDPLHFIRLSPSFLEPYIQKILFSGKGCNLLKTFNYNWEQLETKITDHEYPVNNGIRNGTLPFFNSTFNQKITLQNIEDDGRLPYDRLTNELGEIELSPVINPHKILVDHSKLVKYMFPFRSNSKTKNYRSNSDCKNINYSQPDELFLFQPFNERFDQIFNDYLQPWYDYIGNRLHKVLIDQYYLSKHLRVLTGLYFMQQGESMNNLCDLLFEKGNLKIFTLNFMDHNQMWYDSYILNDIVLNSLKNWKCLRSEDINVWIDDDPGKRPDTFRVQVFEKIRVEYRLPWPIDNIINTETLIHYKEILIFLLQMRRAKCLMESNNDDFLWATNEVNLVYEHNLGLLHENGETFSIYIYILHSETERFHSKLRDMFDFDEIILLHGQFIRTVRDRCLLNERTKAIQRSIIDILNLTIQFKTLYTRYQGERISLYVHSREDKSRLYRDEEPDSDLESTLSSEEGNHDFEFGNIVPTIVDRQVFVDELQRIDKEFTRHKDFVSTSVKGIARAGGFWWFDSLALALG
ncbi:hypothetical protein G9A89_021782 [Geosiphon pyriformis]|nr:hypothetical protein G9A89_021782 [Geosiphon pyriformis]